jgi:RNA polymerase sigma-70 factor (ECF subfamily)
VDDQPGHEALVDAHRGRLLRLCRLLLRDPEEAKDVVQDVFMQAYEAQTQSRAPSDWAAWLTRVAINACHDRHRPAGGRAFAARVLASRRSPLAAGDSSPADRVVSEETRRRIRLAFRKLPDRQREVFVLRYIEDLSTAEVAAALALSPGASSVTSSARSAASARPSEARHEAVPDRSSADRLLAELGKPDERAHLAVCALCTARYRRLETRWPRSPMCSPATPCPAFERCRRAGRWIAAAAALAAVVAGSGSRWRPARGSRSRPRLSRSQAVARRWRTSPPRSSRWTASREGPAAALELDATHEADCETTTPIAGIYCAGGALGLGEGTGALDLEVNGQSTSRAEGRDEGA